MTALDTLLETYDRLSAGSAESGVPLSDLTDVPAMLDDIVAALRAQTPKVELLHYRDPDSECVNTLWIDGKLTQVWEEDVDPGRGYEREDVVERIADIKAAEAMSPDFKKATLKALDSSAFERWGLGDWDNNEEDA